MIQHEKNTKTRIFCSHSNMLGSKSLFYHFLNIPLIIQLVNNLKYCSQKLIQECQRISKAREIQLWPCWGIENEIVVFLINEGSNLECYHGNKIFDILEFLSSCFISVPKVT